MSRFEGEDDLDEERRLACRYSAVGLSVLLLYGSFHPLDFAALAWVALVPLLLAARSSRSLKAVFAQGFGVGLLFHMIGLSWLALCTPEGWVVTVSLEALYTAFSLTLAEFIRRRLDLSSAWILPAVWTAFDFERARYKFFAFPWMLIGQSQHDSTTLLQISDITGIYGVGFLVLMSNAILSEALWSLASVRELFGDGPESAPAQALRAKLRDPALVWLGLLILALTYGAIRRVTVQAATTLGPKLLLVQTDIPSRNDRPPPLGTEVASRNLNLAETLATKYPAAQHGYLAMVFPETSWYHPIDAEGQDYVELGASNARSRDGRYEFQRIRTQNKRLEALARSNNCNLIFGGFGREVLRSADGSVRLETRHNSAYWINPKGELVARFDKLQPAPASEYVPGKGSLLWGWFHEMVRSWVPEGFSNLEPGAAPVIFDIGGFRVGPDICFDVSFAHVMREITKSGVDVHINMSNYAWFRSSQALDFARVQAKLRAIETRRGVVKSVNGGPSLAYDPDGALADGGAALLPHYNGLERRKQGLESNEGGLIVQTRTATSLVTFYTRFGDVFAWSCILGSAIMVVLAQRRGASRQSGPDSSVSPDAS